MHNSDISIAGISKRFHFASLHCIFSAYLPTHIKFLTEFLIPRVLWCKKIPCVVGATQGEIFDEMVRWILSPRLTSTFFLFLVTCQDNVNQSGNVGYVHYAVGVDVASSVSVS